MPDNGIDMLEAGPSSRRYRPSTATVNGSSARMPDMSGTQSQHRKKPRITLDDLFSVQDSAEKAQQGQKLRELQSHIEDARANVRNLKLEDLVKGIEQQNDIFAGVKDTEIGNIDAHVFVEQLELVNKWTKEMHQNMNLFDVEEFLVKTRKLLGLDHGIGGEADDDDEDAEEDEPDEDGEGSARSRRRPRGSGRSGAHFGDWEKIGWMAAKLSRRVTGVEFMYGPLAVEHKKRAQTQRQRRTQQLAPEERPQEIALESRKEKDDTLVNVREVHKALRRADPSSAGLNFFRFAINPDSFGQSVENMFYISFLIRDNKAGIAMTDDGEVLVRYMEPPDEDQGGEVTKHQGVMEFDVDTWEMAKETFGITESMIPHRQPKDTAAPGERSWY